MATRHGLAGTVKIGVNVVAEVQEWTYNEEDPAPLQQLSMGDTVETPVASPAKRGSGTITCLLDEADTTGQGALDVGSSVSLDLQQGAAALSQNNVGTAVVRTRNKSVPKDGFVTIDFSFEGVLTESTVT